MRKVYILASILMGILGITLIAHAAPTSTFSRTLLPEITNTYDLGSSGNTWRNLYTNQICLTGDCKTAWPTGGGSSVSTSSVQSIMLPLIANGTVAGVNATSATSSFLVQGRAGVNPLTVSSSTGTSLLTVTQAGNVGIGITSPNTKLEVAGTASSTGLQVNGNGTITGGALLVTSSNGFGGNIIDAQSFGGSSRFSVDTSGNVTAGNTLNVPTVQGNSSDLLVRSNGTVSGAGSAGISLTNQNTLTFTSGTANTAKVLGNFSPTSGTAAYRSLEITSTINQTGGANGVTRGVYVNNTVTAAADYRALETATGTVLFLNGNVGIGTTTPNARLHVYGSNAFKYADVGLAATTYTVATSTDNIVYVSTTTAATTINLPACIGSTDQVVYTVKDKGGAAGTQNITVTATAGNTIDGASTKVINSAYGNTKVQCVSGSGWFILP